MKMINFDINNVDTFRGFNVVNGQVGVSKNQYQDMLNDVYGDVTICGMTYGQGDALEALDPVAFRCGLSDHESFIQGELEKAVKYEDDSEIEWLDEE